MTPLCAALAALAATFGLILFIGQAGRVWRLQNAELEWVGAAALLLAAAAAAGALA